MESIKKLEEAAKTCLKELREMDSKISIKEGDVLSLEAKKQALTSEVDKLEAQKRQSIDFLANAESNLRKDYESKMRELGHKAAELDGERAKARSMELQAELAAKAANHAKDQYEKLSAECEERITELKARKEKFLAATQGI